jgi:hypothetical protein
MFRRNLRSSIIIVLILTVGAAQPVFSTAKPQTWIELRSTNFIVVTNADEGRRIVWRISPSWSAPCTGSISEYEARPRTNL